MRLSSGTATFTYRAVSSVATGSVGTVTITVNPPSLPTTVDDTFATPTDHTAGSLPGVLANDSTNGGGPMSAVLVANVSHGALTLTGVRGFIYSPSAGFSGSDSSTYRAANIGGPGNIATVSITVNAMHQS